MRKMEKKNSRGYRSWKTKELKHFLLALQQWFFIAGKGIYNVCS
jgi:hypothetical protein